jgi:TonB family protein
MSGLIAHVMLLTLMHVATERVFVLQQCIGAFVLHALWQVPLLACAAALAVRIGRPHVRVAHGIWVATLAACVLLPFASTIFAHRAAVAAADAVVSVSTDGGDIGLDDLPRMKREPVWKLLVRRHVLSPSPFAFSLSPRVAAGVTWLYVLVVMVFAARLFAGWRRTRLLILSASPRPLPGKITRALELQCEAIGCDTPPAALTDDLTGPALAGVLRPILLMPAASVEQMSSAEIDAVLAHELAHLRRGDPLLHAACSLLLLPVGFHPAAVWTSRRVRQTREMACDAEAAERLGSAVGYAHALLQVAERSGGLRAAGVGLGLFGLGFFGLGLFDRDIRLQGGYQAAVRGGRLQHGRRPATAGLPLFGVAGAMEERMDTMMKPTLAETKARRATRGVAAAGLAAVAVLAAAMVQVQPALAHTQDAADAAQSEPKEDTSPNLISGEHAQRQLQKARHQLSEAEKNASTEEERNRILTAQAVIATAQHQLAVASGENRSDVVLHLQDLDALRIDPKVRVQFDALKEFHFDPKVRVQLDAMRNMQIDPKALADAEKVQAEFAAKQAGFDATLAKQMKQFYSSPEWKAEMDRVRTEAQHEAELINSPEFKAQVAAAHEIDHVKIEQQMRASIDAARRQMDAAREQRAEAMQQMREATRQQAEANRLVARNELPHLPGLQSNDAAEDATRARKVDPAIMAGQILNKVMPQYPQSAKDAHITGAVVLHAIIDETGRIEQVAAVSSPDKALTDSAMDAVQRWAYKPYLLNGKPVPVDTSITVNFSLAD